MTTSDQVKKELADFRGLPFTCQSMYWEDLDKDFLIRVLLEWASANKDLCWGQEGYSGAIAKRWGWEAAMEINREVVENYATKYMPRYAEIARVKPQTLTDIMTTIFLSPDGSMQSRNASAEHMRSCTVKVSFESKHSNHLLAKTECCPYAEQFIKTLELFGLEDEIADNMLKQMCTMDTGLGAHYFEVGLPGKRVKSQLIKAPSVKTKGESPICIMEWEVIEE